MTDLVFRSPKGTPVTTSLLVAEVFEKNHAHVLRDIQQLDCPQEFRESNFGLSSYKSSQGKELPMYLITKDGFSFLVMGYNGSRASLFKVKFIEAFNKYDALLKDDDYILSRAMNIMQQRIESLQATNQLQTKALAEVAPKVEYYDEVLQAENTHTTTTIAKELGMSANALNQFLNKRKIIFYQDKHWVLYSRYQGLGYTKTRTHTFETIENDQLIKKTSVLTVWTEKGREFIHDIIKKSK
jgi:Rha family phage regulatory protein